jgi:hypothetical protein
MRQAILVVVVLSLCGCDDPTQLRQDLAACRAKALEVYGPEPPPCFKEVSDLDYDDCKEAAAKKISEHEFRRAPFVSDCMTASGYRGVSHCIGDWGAIANFDFCYERRHLWRDWLRSLGILGA